MVILSTIVVHSRVLGSFSILIGSLVFKLLMISRVVGA